MCSGDKFDPGKGGRNFRLGACSAYSCPVTYDPMTSNGKSTILINQ